MSIERRQDIGTKITWVLVSALISIIMTMTWITARNAEARTQANDVRISIIETKMDNIIVHLEEIKNYMRGHGIHK